jgi:hypothetical protein
MSQSATWEMKDADPTTSFQSAGTLDCYQRLDGICARGEVAEHEERRALWQAVKRDRPSSFLAWQLANVVRWSAPEYLAVDERFTPLRVHVRVRERLRRECREKNSTRFAAGKALQDVSAGRTPGSVLTLEVGIARVVPDLPAQAQCPHHCRSHGMPSPSPSISTDGQCCR